MSQFRRIHAPPAFGSGLVENFERNFSGYHGGVYDETLVQGEFTHQLRYQLRWTNSQ